MSDTFALLFGAAIVFFFSYDRFNLATYEGDGRIDRLVALVSPDKLRARGTVLKAFLFYAVMLLIIYVFLCAYAELVPLLGGPNIAPDATGASQLPDSSSTASQPATGFSPVSGGAVEAWAQPLSGSTGTERPGIGISSSVSLAVALIVVGLAPTFPILKRFDDWMRGVAHQMAGIPTWVVDASRDLRNPLGISNARGGPLKKDEMLLIPPEDWARLRRYRSATKRTPVEKSDEFWNNIELIIATSCWILDEKLSLSRSNLRERFSKLEKALHDRTENLVQRLEGLTSLSDQKTAAGDAISNADSSVDPSESTAAQWEAISKTVDELATDFRMLIALYVEHGIIDYPFLSKTSVFRSQHDAAMAALQKFGEPVRERPDSGPGTYTTPVWVWTLSVTVLVALAWSLLLGGLETELQRQASRTPYWRAFNYSFAGFNVYALTLLVALAIRNEMRRTTLHWTPMVRKSHWTRVLPQSLGVLILSWMASTAFMVAVSIWQSALRLGWPKIKENPFPTVAESFEYNGPTALRGAIMALIILALLDAHRAHSEKRRASPEAFSRLDRRRKSPPASTRVTSLRCASRAAVIMLIAGMLTRFLTFLGGARDGVRTPIVETDGALTGLILYAGLYSALIGFLVVFCLSEVLFYKRRAPSVLPRHEEEPALQEDGGNEPA